MPTGIIYKVFNKVSGKSYIGQTTRTLEKRKQQHINDRVRLDHHFSRALQKYKPEDWEWVVLKEVPVEELDEYEKFFIKDLNTYENGYNSTLGGSWKNGGNPDNCDLTIYELYHPEYGEIRGTQSQLHNLSKQLSNHLSEVINEKRKNAGGFVLLKNKNKYDEILNLHEFYHPDFGVVKGNPQELNKIYGEIFNKKLFLHQLVYNKVKVYYGWCLAKYKDTYQDLIDISQVVTLSHCEYGVQTLKRSEFKKRYNLSSGHISDIVRGALISRKGWHLVENKDRFKPIVDIVTLSHPDWGIHTLSRKEFKKKFNDFQGSGLSQLIIGKFKTYKGWSLVNKISSR